MTNQTEHISKIKEGFKETKLGYIPNEWKVFKLKDILTNTSLGGNYLNNDDTKGYPLIKMGNLERGKISTQIKYFVPINESLQDKHILKNGDILFNTRNTLELVGKVAIWNDEYPLAYYNSNLLRLEFDHKVIGSKKFINYCLNSYSSIKQLKSFATGTTSVAAIYDRDVKILKVVLPSIDEQKAIAKCLNAWDTAIQKLTSLIDKKQVQKKALMQQLLTGKKRLKGFSEKWEIQQLGDFFKERKETKQIDLPLLSIGEAGVYPQSDSNKKDTSNSDKSKYKRICVGDIGYNTMRMWQGRSALSGLEGIVSPAYTIVTPKENSDSKFFSYLFKYPPVIHKFFRNSQGLVSDTLNCKFHDFTKVKILLPKSLGEQKAIARIFKTLDKEVEILEKELSELERQKKGLMQQLLTGKKRLTF